ncbi:MAG: hypothetical protein CVU63_08180 [Deltaproteobacteria bacterium HGW-Deltaproteobacteria-20]|nr:MAG: hypothetical protein CVU63_08180 [Deltaproteobacteria bacterium HGW-Deltaproteobacteria-20]
MFRPTASLAVAILLAASSASAQDSTRFRLHAVHPASAHSPFLVTEGPAQTKAPFAASAVVDYAFHPLRLDVQDDVGQRTLPLVDHAVLLHTTVAARVIPELAFDASWSVAALQIGEDQTVGSRTFRAPGSAVGDLRFGAIHRGALSGSLGYVAGVRAWVPTGDAESYLSDDRFRFEALAGVSGVFAPVRFGCTVVGSPLIGSKEAGERVGAACAADVRVSASGPRVGAELWGGVVSHDPDLEMGSLFEYLGTVGQDAGPMRFVLGVGRGAGSAPGTSAFRAIGLVGFVAGGEASPPSAGASDRDLDGIADANDACPDDAGSEAPDPARHGCPSKDTDGDGIEDQEDGCPTERGARRDDPSTSGCPDRDNDRIVDGLDACADEPAPTYEDGQRPGCPRHARLEGNRFVLTPSPDPFGSPDRGADAVVLKEVAFILRAMPHLTKIAVEVRLRTREGEDESQLADLAVERAHVFARQLVDLGVEISRIEPVGALSKEDPALRILVVDRVDPKRRKP